LIEPTTKAFEQSVVSIIVGFFSFFIGMNLLGMAAVHTYYAIFAKTTNETVRIKLFENESNPLF
jgi:ABC-type uncharacterized transport system permease subunit